MFSIGSILFANYHCVKTERKKEIGNAISKKEERVKMKSKKERTKDRHRDWFHGR